MWFQMYIFNIYHNVLSSIISIELTEE